ncbi:unnamed protein product [marine sediment metagenome]|uniref:Uncharacterized protein n=1 Tax=marine sediment metagenome TaxID=412755 RepID=X0VJL4_9ZZZZ
MATAIYTITNDRNRRVRIEFATDNAAFIDYPDERQRLINKARERNRDGDLCGSLLDTNGNTVGGFREIRG